MSNTVINSSQLFDKLKSTKNPLIKPLIPIEIEPLFPILYKNGVTVITHQERRISSQLVTFLSSQMIKNHKKILHICLEEHVEDIFINYLSNFSNEKIRNIKNKNHSITHLEPIRKMMDDYLGILPIKNENDTINELSNKINSFIDQTSYTSLIIIEGLDKLFSVANRQVLMRSFLSDLSLKAQEKECAIVCAFKEDNFEDLEKITYVKLEGKKIVTVMSKGDKTEILLIEDYCQFVPDFSNYKHETLDRVCVGYSHSAKGFLYNTFNDHDKAVVPFVGDKDPDNYINFYYNLNYKYKNDFYVISDKKIEGIDDSHVFSLRASEEHVQKIYEEYMERKSVIKESIVEYEKLNPKLKKHFIVLSSAYLSNFIENKNKVLIPHNTIKIMNKMLKDCHNYGIIIKLITPNVDNYMEKEDVQANFGFLPNINKKDEIFRQINLMFDTPVLISPIVNNFIQYSDSEEREDLYPKNPFKNFKNIKEPTKEEIKKIVKLDVLSNKMVYGYNEKNNEYIVKEYFYYPGALYCGGVGCGKSGALRFTLLLHYLSNVHRTKYYLVDILKGMSDFEMFFDKKNVKKVLDIQSFLELVESLHVEINFRSNLLSETECNGIKEYNLSNPDAPLDTIIIAVEELQSIMKSKELDYMNQCEIEGTYAYGLRRLMRLGRSYGIYLLATSSRATSDDLPESIRLALNQMMAFRTMNPGDISALGLPHSSDINMNEEGRCAYEGGYSQFPYISDDMAKELMDEYEFDKENIQGQSFIDE